MNSILYEERDLMIGMCYKSETCLFNAKKYFDMISFGDFDRIILASKSPRRQQILQQLMGYSGRKMEFEIIPSDFAEDHPKSLSPAQYVQMTSTSKSTQVFDSLHINEQKVLVIGMDTIVTKSGIIYEKPSDKVEAKRILLELSGSSHHVITAVSLVHNLTEPKKIVEFTETTTVYLRELNDGFLDQYVSSDEPWDKAGGYGYQSMGMLMVERIEGCYYNVVGFPVHAFVTHIEALQ